MRRLAAAIRPRWLDMTNEMLALATRNAAERNGQNVRFLKGEIEAATGGRCVSAFVRATRPNPSSLP